MPLKQPNQYTTPYRGGRLANWTDGVDNRKPDHELKAGFLRDAVNVDISQEGKIHRRRGITQVLADSGAHSLYSDGIRMLWATGTELKVSGPALVPRTLLTDSGLAGPLSYATVNGTTYFSNESINGVVTPDLAGVHESWGIALPADTLAAPYDAGVPEVDVAYYQVACTFLLSSGEESGAHKSVVARVDKNAGQSLALTGIPQPSDARVTQVALYASSMHGEVLYRHTTLPVGVTSYTIAPPYGLGQALRTQFHAPPPAGQLVEYLDGRLVVASGSTLWFTSAFNYRLVDMRANFISFPERITLAKAVSDGLYVSADETYFLRGLGTPEMSLSPVLPYKAIEGAAARMPNSHNAVWLSERGFVLGQPGGQVENLSEGRVAVELADRGCLGFVERNGDRRIIAVMRDGREPALAAADFLVSKQAQLDEVR